MQTSSAHSVGNRRKQTNSSHRPWPIPLFLACLSPCGFLVLAQQRPSTPPSFGSDILPILRNSCTACHDADLKSGELRLDTYDGLMKGGKRGVVVIPGNSDKSLMVLMIEGKVKPEMPMGGGPLMQDEIAAIKAWIDAGAKPSSSATPAPTSSRPAAPKVKPLVSSPAQVSSLAFHPSGSTLAIAGYKQVMLLDPSRHANARRLTGPTDFARALAYSPDGKYIAAAGGPPARQGEVTVWSAGDGRVAHTLKGHTDYIYSVAFSPDGNLIATSSYDKLVKLWDAATGRELRTLKDHIEAVYPVEFSPNGKWLASGSADRTVKIWEVESGKRLFTLSDALDTIYALSFHPSGNAISAAGADRYIRTWELSAEGGVLTRSIIAHEDAIIALKYSPDGRSLVSAGQDRLIKIWDADKGVERRVLPDQSDWPLAVVFAPDGKRLAVGRYDGSVSLYEVANGRRVDLIP